MQDTPDPARAKKLSLEYEVAKESGDFVRAIEIAAEIIERKGLACTAGDWFQYGYCLLELCEFTAAVESYDKSIELDPDDSRSWTNRGNALGNLGNYPQALESYDKALEIDPSDYKAWYNRGYVLDTVGQPAEAIESYDKALAIKPDFTPAWYNRGYALFDLGLYNQAIESYDKAIAIDPGDADAWNSRAYTLDKLGEYDQALESYGRAIEINPRDARSWNNRGYILTILGKYTEAMASYDESLKHDPAHTRTWFNRGGILIEWNKWEEFLATLEQGFTMAKPSDKYQGHTGVYCTLLFQQGGPKIAKRVSTLIDIYVRHDATAQLGEGLIQSISALIERDVSQRRAEAWLAAWQTAGEGKPEMEIPLRLLAAAVAWKSARDVRALLALPIEERRILEQIIGASEAGPQQDGAE
jgi:tetratricopeptide (TPR) repeat protein